MLVLETVLRIRREHAGGKPIKAIVRDLRLSRKVVRKAIRSPEAVLIKHHRLASNRDSGKALIDVLVLIEKHGKRGLEAALRGAGVLV